MKCKFTRLFILPVLGGAVLLEGSAREVAALENSVRVESKSVIAGTQDVHVAVFVDNRSRIDALDLPLELRSLDSGAFISQGTSFMVNPAGRMYDVPFTWGGCPFPPLFERPFPGPESLNTCSGPVSSSFDYPAGLDLTSTSPDGHYLNISGGCGPLEAQSDPSDPDSASLLLAFDVGMVPGRMLIDTCCIIGRHILFVTAPYTDHLPRFQTGVLTILPDCICACQADPSCDGVTSMADIVLVIDRAFRGAAAVIDPACVDSSNTDGLTDVDCSGSTDIVDVTHMIDVALRGSSAEAHFCLPCAEGAPKRTVCTQP